MSNFSPNYNGNQKPGNNLGQFILMAFITLNGISTGNVIRTGHDIATNGADSNTIIALMLYLGCTIYTAQRAIEIYKKIHKNDNDKSR